MNYSDIKYEVHVAEDLKVLDAFQMAGYFIDTTTYSFENHFHPFVGELLTKLNRGSVQGMCDPDFLSGLKQTFFSTTYSITPSLRHFLESFDKEIDVSPGGAYTVYNWELFLHIPVAIAVHLSKNRRFAEAQRWFHLVFDPTATDTSVAPPKRYWNFLAFRAADAGFSIDEMLALLAKPDSECTDPEITRKQQILLGYQQVIDHPFNPHAVARTRPIAYMYDVVMRYLDNLIDWGDHLFRQDTLETINEATQIYVLAASILGERPQQVPTRGRVRPRSFAQLKAEGLDPTGNLLVELEGQFPFNLGAQTGGGSGGGSAPLLGIGRTLYFCVPRNDKLLGYWTRVENRLFNIRHCLNIEGVARPLALFDPPIDPGLLVKAGAAGLDLGAAIAGLNQPVSNVRASLLVQKAQEIASETKSLGALLLAASEKGDAEELSLLRQGHEIEILTLQRDAKFLAWKQAQEATEALNRTRASARERYAYYLRLLGQTVDADLVPEMLDPDRRELTEESFDDAYASLVGAFDKPVPMLDYPGLDVEPASGGDLETLGRLSMIGAERDELAHMAAAQELNLASWVTREVGAGLAFIPDINVDLHYWGLGATTKIPIGTALSSVTGIAADIIRLIADWESAQGQISGRTAAHARRTDEWIHQANLAARELLQIGRQMIGALIAEQIAKQDYEIASRQIEQSEDVLDRLKSKFTNAELYGWMQGELSKLFYETYRFAFDTARRAEVAMKAELMRPELDAKTLVRFNYWDGGRKGLLSGEALALDVRRMEMAYHEHNRREYELVKHVSLMQVDPMAVIALRTAGRCTVRLPESLFDMDGPGQYMRRIKRVALSLPSVSGPYGGVNCKLTLLKSSIRTQLGGAYPREDDDARFRDYYGAVQSVVASATREDDGLFDESARDERYRPFENAGAISTWSLELPADPSSGDPQLFDYRTISDAVLHLHYTAREGGAAMRDAAMTELKKAIDAAEAAGSVRLFSIRHDFPMAWARLQAVVAPGKRHELLINIGEEHYPYWSKNRLASVTRFLVIAAPKGGSGPVTIADRADLADAGSTTDVLPPSSRFPGFASGELVNLAPPAAPTGQVRYFLNSAALDDLWLALTWGA